MAQTIQDTAQNIQATAQNIQATAQNIQDTTQNIQDAAQNINITAQNIQNSAQNIHVTAQNIDTARGLRDERVNDFKRVQIAILTYSLSLATGFFDATSPRPDNDPPGHRLAYPLLFSWSAAMVVLSGTTGRFVTKRSCTRLIQHFQTRLVSEERIPNLGFARL